VSDDRTEPGEDMVKRAAAMMFSLRVEFNATLERDPTAEEYARAMIEAMRQPTWPMMYAGSEFTEADPGDIWRAMIDAALKQEHVK